MKYKLTLLRQYRGLFSLLSDVYYFIKVNLSEEDTLFVDISDSLYSEKNIFDELFYQEESEYYDKEFLITAPGQHGIVYEITSSNYHSHIGYKIMQDLSSIVMNRFIIKDHILDEINSFYDYNFTSCVFGLQKRGTDMYRIGHGRLLYDKYSDIKFYSNIIETNLLKFNKCFLMTDEEATAVKLKQEFCDDIIIYPSLKSDTGESIHSKFNKNVNIAKEVLIETVLLSRCNKIFATLSNIPIFAICYGNNFNFEFIDIGDKYVH